MRQIIRLNTFETNSSSYHTLSITNKSCESNKRTIVKDQDLVINNHIEYKTIGYTESYSFTGTGTYEKAQMVLRFMGCELTEQFDSLGFDDEYREDPPHPESSSYRPKNWDNFEISFKKHFYEIPLIQAFVKAIKKYIGEDRNVVIEFNRHDDPYIETVSDYDKSTYEVFNIESTEDLANIEKMSEVFYNIIFDSNIEMTEECESNE